jgi:hypothetical protein
MDVGQESKRWLNLGIIDETQRRQILSLYDNEGISLAVLGILWVGGALVFLGVAFLLGIAWEDLGASRGLIVGLIDAAFFAGGVWIGRSQPTLEKTQGALLVIGGLLLPMALGVTYEDLFGSSGHFLPLVVVCGSIYAGVAWRLRSRAFCFLLAFSLFWLGEEIVRDTSFSALFPLVQLGVVSKLSDVFPVVFLTLGGVLVGLAFLAGRHRDYAHLRGTLLACGLLVALLPALVGGLMRPFKGFKLFLALAASLGSMGLAVALRESRSFWLSGACLVGAFLILFGDFFENSVAFMIFAVVLGLATMAAGTYLGTQKDTWVQRLFADEDTVPLPDLPRELDPKALDPKE